MFGALALLVAASVFGVPIGAPLDLPACTPWALVPTADDPDQAVTCRGKSDHYPAEVWDVTPVTFSKNAEPGLLGGGKLYVHEIMGSVVGFEIDTNGISDEEFALTELTHKFGQPKVVKRSAVQNLSGGSFQSIYAEWSGDLIIRFDGTLSKLDEGKIVISTPAAQAAQDKVLLDLKKAQTAF